MTDKLQLEIDPKFIDVEFEEHEPGTEKFAGMLPHREEDQAFGADWPTNIDILDSRQWRDYKEEQYKVYDTYTPARILLLPISNQNPESSCVLNSEEHLFRLVRNRMLGWQYELLFSPMWSYQRICRSRHSGSYTMDALRHGMETGHCPQISSHYSPGGQWDRRMKLAHDRARALCPHTYHQNTPYVRKNDESENERTAGYFLGDQWIRIDSKNKHASALLYGWPICNGRSGHSIAHCDLVQDSRGNWVSEYLDSYGPSRGSDGRLWDSQRMWQTSGAWALRTIHISSNPLFPCGKDTKEVSLTRYYDLFPDLERDLIQQYYDQGPGDEQSGQA